MKVNVPFAALFSLISIISTTQISHAQVAHEPHTAAAVIAADKGWTIAEEKGDIAYLDTLLLPAYRSVSPDGSVHDKEAILAGARKATPARAAMIEKYLADHPQDTAVTIVGDTAVLTFSATNDAKKLIRSSDIFVYQHGRWHAIYSQHTNAEKS